MQVRFWRLKELYHHGGQFRRRRLQEMAGKVLRELKRGNLDFFLEQTFIYLQRWVGYRFWISRTESWQRAALEAEIARLSYQPTISILTPVYNVDPRWLDRCITSVLQQVYPRWELCLYDDASDNPATRRCLQAWEDHPDPRLKVSWGERRQHISRASNDALAMASGEFIGLLDHDDELSPLALHEVVKLLNEHPEADFIYSDEDKLTMRGVRRAPFFKPDWSPDLFFSLMYTCHLGIYRKALMDKIGGFRPGFEGAQDYDLVLRLIEQTSADRIFHIPRVLYHWRQIPGSAAAGMSEKGYAHEAGKRALTDYMHRQDLAGEVVDGFLPGFYRLHRQVPDSPRVSIIIPFRDGVDLLRRCVTSILTTTDESWYDLILINNRSTAPETRRYLAELSDNPAISIHDFDADFNFSALINFGVGKSRTDLILILNNDTEVINSDWLTAMREHLQRPEVGVVGAKLYYPDQTIQHGGVVIGIAGTAGHAFKHFPGDHPGYCGLLNAVRNCSAVTGACMLFKKELFNRVGGFDEVNLPINYNDIDFCLKVRERGYLVVWTPFAQLYHYENATKGDDAAARPQAPDYRAQREAERAYFQRRWQRVIAHDPYYNPNLTRRRNNYALRFTMSEMLTSPPARCP